VDKQRFKTVMESDMLKFDT